MDGLSGAASVIAVVSFTIQLAEGAKKLYDFWQSVDEAPDSVKDIVTDLKLLSTTLAEIALHEQNRGNNGSVTDILESSTEKIQIMLRMMAKLEHGLDSKSIRIRKWSSVKAVIKEEKIAKFQRRLLDVKTTLLLARQTLSDRSIQAHFNQNKQLLFAISQNMDMLRDQNVQTFETLSDLVSSSKASTEEALEVLLDRTASHIANPFLRSGFKKTLATAVKQAQEDLEQGQQLRGNAGTSDISLARSLKLNRQWYLPTTGGSRKVKTIFGDIVIQTSSCEITTARYLEYCHKDHGSQHQIRIIFRPAAWLVRFGLAYELQLRLVRSVSILKTTFQTFQPVPDDSLIFDFCRAGNIQGVKTLFSRKQASIWDTNSNGWTPLHLALHTCQLDIVQFLLSQGADCDAVTHRQKSCLEVYVTMGYHSRVWSHKEGDIKAADLRIYLISHFAHQFDWPLAFDDLVCEIIDCSCKIDYDTSESELESQSENETRLFHLFKAFAKSLGHLIYTSERVGSDFWNMCVDLGGQTSLVEWATSTYKDSLDARPTEDGFSPILLFVIKEKWDAVKAFVKHGADLHYLGQDLVHSPVGETVTSLSLYSSRWFWNWRNILRDRNTNIVVFIEDELRRGRLRENGWDFETLKTLFDLELSPILNYLENPECGCLHTVNSSDSDEQDDEGGNNSSKGKEECGEESEIMVEVSWQTLLERVKHGESLVGYLEKYSCYSDSESDLQESRSFSGDSIDISETEGSENEEMIEVGNADVVVANDDENSERLESINEEGDIDEENDDERGWTDGSSRSSDGSETDEADEGEYEVPQWFCISCWYEECAISSPSPSVVLLSEAEEDEEGSPMLLSINI